MSGAALTPEGALESTATLDGSSRLGEWQRCTRGYHLRYHLGIARKRKALPLRVGSLVHACLRWTHAKPAGDPRNWTYVIQAAERLAAETGEAAAGWDEPSDTDEAYRLMAAYFGKWGDDGGWGGAEIVAVEQHLEDPALRVTCRADLLVRIHGSLHVVDTKTRASALPGKPGDFKRADWIKGQAVNEEFLRISHCVQKAYGLPAPPPVIVDAIVKTKVPAFERVTIPITAEAVGRWAGNQIAVAADMQLADGAGGFAPSPGRMTYGACVPFAGGPCWAFDWCHSSAEMRERCYVVGETAPGVAPATPGKKGESQS